MSGSLYSCEASIWGLILPFRSGGERRRRYLRPDLLPPRFAPRFAAVRLLAARFAPAAFPAARDLAATGIGPRGPRAPFWALPFSRPRGAGAPAPRGGAPGRGGDALPAS